MTAPFAVDKLTIINDCLIATGNQPVSVIEDGSDEWTAGSNFYDRMLPVILAKHDWKFALALAEMERTGSSNYPGYQDMYALPADCLLLRQACDDRDIALIQPIDARVISQDGINLPAMDYRIIGSNVHCIAPAGATALYVQNQVVETPFIVGFVEALRLSIEALLYRGLNEDVQAAAGAVALAKEALVDAREQDSGQEPRRILFRSPMLEKRRRRRNFWGIY